MVCENRGTLPFSDFIGNASVATTLQRMLAEDRLPQTLLFAGPRGVGKATLARFLAAAALCPAQGPSEFCGACSSCRRVLAADLSLPEYCEMLAEREKLPANKRADAPLIVATHPDFLTFPPDGPMRLIGVEQARQLRNAAQYNASEGRHRIFLIDEADRANDEAANSLLKTLEEPGPQLTIILTAENPYELLPTIRSRSVPFYFSPLTLEQMRRFFQSRAELSAADRERLAAWAQGSPGRALEIDPIEYVERRAALLALLETSLDAAGFGQALASGETLGRRGKDKLELLNEILYGLLSDIVRLSHGVRGIVNEDIRPELEALARRAGFHWIIEAAEGLDDIEEFRRRNIQKQIALEAWAIRLRRAARAV
jgi:DNA polymerase-3 subunit delta'